MPEQFTDPRAVMRRAIELAARGQGFVEPNPQVGAVIVDENLRLIGEGWHQRFGGAHAEVEALYAAGSSTAGRTMYVTLEPCCHHGKTGPCTQAIIDAGIRHVVVAMVDPSPHAAGRGLDILRNAGITVDVGLLSDEAEELTAPFVTRVTRSRPWVHAKWAMTLDGKITSKTGISRWISGEPARERVHQLRGWMDAILIGSGTARRDDPLLTARPPGQRIATRVVVDTQATLSANSQLVATADQTPLIVAVAENAPQEQCQILRNRGVEALTVATRRAAFKEQLQIDLQQLLRELGRRGMTNVLVEGGGRLLGSLFDERLIDEVHVFLSPKLIGGVDAVSPIEGLGLAEMSKAATIPRKVVELVGDDIYLRGRVRYVES